MNKRKVTLICLCLALVVLVGAITVILLTSGEKVYTVKFVYEDGSLIKEVKVNPGEDAETPIVPDRNGEVFVYWSHSVKNVTKNMTVTAKCYKATQADWQSFSTVYDKDSSSLTGASLRLSKLNNEDEDKSFIVFPNTNDSGGDIKAISRSCLNNDGVSVEVKTVVIPYGVVKIEENAFDGCYRLETVILPDSLKEIASNAFQGCTALKNVQLPSSLKYVYGNSFKGCYNLNLSVRNEDANLKVSDDGNIYSADGRTFVAYTNYKQSSLEIGGKVSYIGEKAFYATDIYSVRFTSHIISIESEAFRDCADLRSIINADRLESISDKAFRGCTSLSEFIFASSLTKIGAEAFYNTALSRVFLPENLRNIGSKAFRNYGEDNAVPEVTTIYTPLDEYEFPLDTSDWACKSPVYFNYDGSGKTVELVVTFVYIDQNGEEQFIETKQVEYGKYCPLPSISTIQGSIIRRWNASDKKGTYIDPMQYLTSVTKNITIYAEI